MNALSLVRRSPVIPVFAIEDFLVLYADDRFADRALIKDGLPLLDIVRLGFGLGLTFTVELHGTEPRVIAWFPSAGKVAA